MAPNVRRPTRKNQMLNKKTAASATTALAIAKRNLKIATEALKQANKLNQVKTAIISTVAHELRTPLSAIVGFTELISLKTTDEEIRDYANTASRGANKLSMIIDNMLDLSKIDEGRFERKIELVELKTFIENVVALFTQVAHEKKIDLLADVSQSISIKCNEAGLTRIAFNLVNNAIKFTTSGSVTFRCKKGNANTVVLEVEDTGIGIPSEDIPKLFDRFSDVDHQRHPQGKGAGLGLSLVKELLTIMGGKISVDSELNRGTRVSIELPVTPPLSIK